MAHSKYTRGRRSQFGMEILETRKLAANFGFAQVDAGPGQAEIAASTVEVSSQRLMAGIDATHQVDGGVNVPGVGSNVPGPCLPEPEGPGGNVFPGEGAGTQGTLGPLLVDSAMQSGDWYASSLDG